MLKAKGTVNGMRHFMGQKRAILVLVVLAMTAWHGGAYAGDTWLDAHGFRTDNVNLNGQHVTNLTYAIDPPFLSAKVRPNVLLILDNSGSMAEMAYRTTYDPTIFAGGRYFGYFEPDTMYRYDTINKRWAPTTADVTTATVANPIAQGDLLNWAYMNKIETVKELLIGGRADPRAVTTGSVIKNGETSASGTLNKSYDNSANAATDKKFYPFDGNYKYARSGKNLNLTLIGAATSVNIYTNGDLVSPASWLKGGSSAAATLWQSIDDNPNPDNDVTTIRNTSSTTPVLFKYSYTGATTNPIAEVSIITVAKKSSNNTINLQGVLRINGTDYADGWTNLTSTSHRQYVIANWSTNPATSLPWTWDDINDIGTGGIDGFGLQASIGSSYNNPTSSRYPTVTQTYILISTSIPAGGPYVFDVDTGKKSVTGVIDEMAYDARVGLAWYNADQGGQIARTTIAGTTYYSYVDFGASDATIKAIREVVPTNWTPLSETLYEMIRYFRQNQPDTNIDGNNTGPYYAASDFTVGQLYDPYYFQYSKLVGSGLTDQYVPCAKSFILLLTDGEPTQDLSIPTNLKDYDGDGEDPGTYPSNGSDYLDDVALYGRTMDQRPDISGTQNIILYTAFMFGRGSTILMNSTINGGFEDLDGDNKPGCTLSSPTQDQLRECYRDSNNNGVLDPYDATTNPDGDYPLTYYEGDDGYDLQTSIIDAIAAMMKRAASGTSVSVLGSSWKGEGAMFQAYFYPEKVEGMRRVKWTGYFHSLFIDRNGLIHEDTDGDGVMIPDNDYVLQFEFVSNEDTKLKYFYDRVNNADPSDHHPDGIVDSSVPIKIVAITEAHTLWDGGKMLAYRDPADRTIYTSLDADTATPPGTNPTTINFSDANKTDLRPYLRAKTDAAAANLINFVRGAEITGWRDRNITVDGAQKTWKLGDIVFSDPVMVGPPKERFDLIYNDKTYADYYDKWSKRRGTVVVGGNDGMLHAFNTGYYLSTTKSNPDSSTPQITFCTSLDATDTTKCGPVDADRPLGKEMWGFVPPDVLPHLAWMADPDYYHLYYVDNMIRVTDARIFAEDADHPKGWGTILLVSLRFGGPEIDVTDTFGVGSTTKQFKSAYYCLDVTNPDLPPKLMWRFTDYNMGFTLSVPTIVREESGGIDTWYAVMGSGPTNYRGGKAVDATITNTKFTQDTVVSGLKGMDYIGGFLYIVNLATGAPDDSWTAHPSSGRKGVLKGGAVPLFITSPTAVDYPLDFKYDMIYFSYIWCSAGCSADGYGTWGGSVQRLKTFNLVDPGKWVWSNLFNTSQPVTVKPAVGVDKRGNIWVYYGTGRFLHVDDRFNTVAQNSYGIKDPCYFANCTTTVVNGTNILNSSLYTIKSDGTFTPTLLAGTLGTSEPSSNINTFDDLATYMQDKGEGWKITLGASERVIVNGFVVGGIAGFGSYTPTTSICEFEGRSKQYFPYYLTGTVPYSPGGTFLPSVSVDTGGGLPSIPAVHIDSAGRVKLFLQKSTGEIQVVEMRQAQTVTGGLGSGGECD